MIVDSGGFILARRATRGSEGDWKPAYDILEQLPIKPETLAADTGYSAGLLRKKLEDLGVAAYIPIHPNQDNSVVARRGFTYHGDHLVCPEGKILGRRAFHRRDSSYQYVARQKDCQRCPVKTECLPPRQKRRYVALTMYQPVYLRARKRNESEAYEQEMKSRHATVEGSVRFTGQAGLGAMQTERTVERWIVRDVKGGDMLDHRGGGILYHQGLSAQGKCPL